MSEGKEKFTPGPWIVVANFSNAYVCYGEPEMHDKNTVPPNQCVCGCGRKDWDCGDGDNLKNAYLIAAAPEMYDTLAACESSLDIVLKDVIIPEYIKEIVQDIILTISHTLKKARGEE